MIIDALKYTRSAGIKDEQAPAALKALENAGLARVFDDGDGLKIEMLIGGRPIEEHTDEEFIQEVVNILSPKKR